MRKDGSILLIETIKIEHRKPVNLHYHTERFNESRRILFQSRDDLDLEQCLTIPDTITGEVHKCRLTYGREILNIEFEPYHRKNISSLKLVVADDLDYSFKYADRSGINALFSRRGPCDDILIVRNGLVTDTSYANLAFRDGDHWVTPRNPLLRGTCRARLLAEENMQERDVRPEDIPGFDSIRIFNAMMDVSQPLHRLKVIP